MNKFVLKNGETRFQNAKTVLSRIFFARTGMDSAQKKACNKSIWETYFGFKQSFYDLYIYSSGNKKLSGSAICTKDKAHSRN